METIQIKNKEGRILYTHTQDNNTIKITLERAVKDKVELIGAELVNLDLTGAKLRGAKLFMANLEGSKLNKADLAEANLIWSILSKADLTDSYMYNTHLRWAYLNKAKGLTFDMLEGVKSLKAVIGLEESLRYDLAVCKYYLLT